MATENPDAALRVLADELQRLRPFFDEEDEDDDAGWHRSQAKTWQLWALGKLVTRALGAIDADERDAAAARIREVAPKELHETSILPEEKIGPDGTSAARIAASTSE